MKGRGVELLDDIDDEPDQMILGQPLSHIRWEQELLITHNRTIRTSHTPSFRTHRRDHRTWSRVFATASL